MLIVWHKIEINDLPEALEVLVVWKSSKKQESKLAQFVNKEEIAKSVLYYFPLHAKGWQRDFMWHFTDKNTI
jgi:hypothetical protein